MDYTQISEYIYKTAGITPVSIAPVSGGLTLSGKYKACLNGNNMMVKILPGTPIREQWYKELNSRSNEQMANPKNYRLFEDGNLVLLSPWIEGQCLEDALKGASPKQVEEYGRQAAQILKRLHSNTLDYPAVAKGVLGRIEKACSKIEDYKLTFPGHKECCEFLQNEAKSHNFGQFSIVHKDIRPENFIVNNGLLYLYDFDNGGLGEREEDFAYLLTLGRPEHRPFSYALINEYLKKEEKESFFRSCLLYSALQVAEYAVWKWETKKKQVYFQGENLLRQYNCFKQSVPLWWKEREES